MNLCNEPEVLRAFYIVKIIITYIQVLVPILLILVGIKAFYNYLVDEKGNLREIVRSFITKIIIAMLIIFIPILINGFLKFVDLKDTTYDACLLNANEEGISKAYTSKAKDYILQAKRKLTRAMYRQALLYTEHVDDIKEYNNMQKELKKVDGYVDIAEKINTLTMKNYSKLYSELEKDIKGVSEEEVRETLNEKLEVKKKSIATFIGKYPAIPFGEYPLYKNLKAHDGISLESILEKNGSSVEELSRKIEIAVETAGKGTRAATTAAAVTLIGTLADYKYKLPYYWGGKRNKMGVDGTWGLYKTNPYCESYADGDEAKLAHCNKDLSWWGMDCSGFVNWTISQATGKKLQQSDSNNGPRVNLKSGQAVCQVGDALETKGHIVIIIALDDKNSRYIIAEESAGLEIRSVPYSGKRGSSQYWCLDLSHNYIE